VTDFAEGTFNKELIVLSIIKEKMRTD